MAYLDLTGKTFNNLTVESHAFIHEVTRQHHWNCLCKCGNRTVVSTQALRENKTKSCGCFRRRRGAESPLYRSMDKRFWNKVQKTPTCWFWMASRNAKGYGTLKGGAAHRQAWRLTNGEIPGGAHVLHRCDNPPCVNPDHLFLGTNDDNVKDKIAKGRMHVLHGSQCPQSLLTEDQVREIKRKISESTRKYGAYSLIAKEYGVSKGVISIIATGKGWRHVI